MPSLPTIPFLMRGGIASLVFIIAVGLVFGLASFRPQPTAASGTAAVSRWKRPEMRGYNDRRAPMLG